MHRSFTRILFVSGCVLALCLAGLGQTRSVAAATPENAPTTSPTTGKIDVTFQINIADSWIPSSSTIACEVTLNVQGESTTFRETAALTATRTGNSASCVVPIYYSWLLQDRMTDTISLTYDVAVPPETTLSPTLPYRENSQAGSITPVPVNGTVTRLTVDVTL
jgi:hypothetical protein